VRLRPVAEAPARVKSGDPLAQRACTSWAGLLRGVRRSVRGPDAGWNTVGIRDFAPARLGVPLGGNVLPPGGSGPVRRFPRRASVCREGVAQGRAAGLAKPRGPVRDAGPVRESGEGADLGRKGAGAGPYGFSAVAEAPPVFHAGGRRGARDRSEEEFRGR
jgi:hypothetical protein